MALGILGITLHDRCTQH